MSKASDIAHEIATQDNRITADPIFVVQRRVRDCGYDPAYADECSTVWLDVDCNEVTDEELAEVKAEYEETGEEPDGYTLTSYVDRWEFVQPFLTLAAAEEFAEGMRRKGDEYRVYVDSGYRNHEWQWLRTLPAYAAELEQSARQTWILSTERMPGDELHGIWVLFDADGEVMHLGRLCTPVLSRHHPFWWLPIEPPKHRPKI